MYVYEKLVRISAFISNRLSRRSTRRFFSLFKKCNRNDSDWIPHIKQKFLVEHNVLLVSTTGNKKKEI